MFYIKKAANTVLSCSVSLLPILLSAAGVINHSPILIALLPFALLTAAAFTPWARNRENVWLFLLTAVSGIPINIMLIRRLLGLPVFESCFFLLTVFRGAALYIMLLSAEELMLGVITRMIWKKQYKISFPKERP